MKKLIALCALLAACHTAPPATSSRPVLQGNLTGAPDVTSAVRGFMNAVSQTDLQAMGAIWGGPDGAARDAYSRDELEKRELIMICYLKHDNYDILADAPAPGGGRDVAVNVTFKDLTRSTNFRVVRGPASRWYVEDVSLPPLQDICNQRG
ncbi:MAG TPA: hypothetical protein VHB25_13440 [Gemmatimonadaceae bacterium]|nr:hypothetical protein [Gemmatimonadaceae bacterium]